MIRVDGIGKSYRLGAKQASYSTLRDALAGAVRAPFARRGAAETVWALRDVSFEVEAGEVVAVIGRNGAGKSTLLKILSRITEPTAGRVELYGRVGSLLEVGTGFHPELTGRENIYFSGSILGMRREEIARKFDEIVAFAEVERFIDTPVKHYSSGMYMRLAFAVAAHLEPEILLVDEVLAVGDAAFQQKCLGKMGEVARAGRTVLFVSHNMTAVNQLCPRAILIADGRVARDGSTAQIVPEYLKTESGGGEWVWDDSRRAPGNDKVRLRAVRVVSGGRVTGEVNIDEDIAIEVEFWNYAEGARNLCADIYLHDSMGTTVLSTAGTPAANALPEEWFARARPAGLFRATCTLPGNFLNDGTYHVGVNVLTLGPMVVEASVPQALSFNVFDTGTMREPGAGGVWPGVVRPRLPWRTEFLGRQPGAAD